MKHDDHDETGPPSDGQRLTDYLLGELDPGEQERLERDLEEQPELRRRLQGLAATLEALRGVRGPAALGETRREALRRAARRRLQPVWRRPSSLAAAAVLLLAAGLAWRFLPDGPGASGSEATASAGRAVAAPPSAGAGPAKGRPTDSAAGAERGALLGQMGYAGAEAFLDTRGEAPAEPIWKGAGDTVPPGAGERALPGLVERESLPGPPAAAAPATPAGEALRHQARPAARAAAPVPPEALHEGAASVRARDRDGKAARQEASLDAPGEEERLFLDDKDVGEEAEEEGDPARPAAPAVEDGYGRVWAGPAILEHLRPLGPGERPRDMFFRFYGDNPFVPAELDPLATWAADVDTASYALTRNYLRRGLLPPPAAVRTEEFVNAFDYGLAAPEEEDFALHLAYGPSRFGGHRPAAGEGRVALLQVGLKAREVALEERKPLVLTFVVDVSGSMREGGRLDLVRRSLELLLDRLREDDAVGVVAFSDHARLILETTPVARRGEIREALRGLEAGGSTNAAAGLTLGYQLAEASWRSGAVNRVILCTDGVANTGETDQDRILEQVARFRERQVDLTALGVGMGNHNDVFLERLADQGDGSCHYIDTWEEARRVFLDEFTGTLQTIARDVRLQAEFDPRIVRRWRQLGYENRRLADRDFRDDTVDAGEIGAGHECVALFELELAPGASLDDGGVEVRLRWRPDGQEAWKELRARPGAAGRADAWEEAPHAFRLAAVVAQFAEVLRDSYWARGDSYADLLKEADRLAEESTDARVAEFRDLVQHARPLLAARPVPDELARLVDACRDCRVQEQELRWRAREDPEARRLLPEFEARCRRLEKQLRSLVGGGR